MGWLLDSLDLYGAQRFDYSCQRSKEFDNCSWAPKLSEHFHFTDRDWKYCKDYLACWKIFGLALEISYYCPAQKVMDEGWSQVVNCIQVKANYRVGHSSLIFFPTHYFLCDPSPLFSGDSTFILTFLYYSDASWLKLYIFGGYPSTLSCRAVLIFFQVSSIHASDVLLLENCNGFLSCVRFSFFGKLWWSQTIVDCCAIHAPTKRCPPRLTRSLSSSLF